MSKDAKMIDMLTALGREILAEQARLEASGSSVRPQFGNVRALTHNIVDRAPKGVGVTFGMCETAAKAVLS